MAEQLLFARDELSGLDLQFLVAFGDPLLQFIPLATETLLALVEAMGELSEGLALLFLGGHGGGLLFGEPTTLRRDRLYQLGKFDPVGQLRPDLFAGDPRLEGLLVQHQDFGSQLFQSRLLLVSLLLSFGDAGQSGFKQLLTFGQFRLGCVPPSLAVRFELIAMPLKLATPGSQIPCQLSRLNSQQLLGRGQIGGEFGRRRIIGCIVAAVHPCEGVLTDPVASLGRPC
ncbi:MAG TPA: hypothetical protein PLV92_10575 [Pirellulaceae bacterium]|nr:hypothetical protein [Pirellulaceae bacterium]